MPFKFNPFTGKLDEFGPVLTGTGTVSAAADGTEESPGIAFASDLDTGIYRPDADQLAISTNGTERVEFGTSEVVFNDGGENYDFRIEGDTEANLVFVDASTNRVGLGTSTPQTLFELAANNATGGNNTLRFNDTDATTQPGQQVGAIEFFSNDTIGGSGVIGKIECYSQGTVGNGIIGIKTGYATTLDTRLTIDDQGLVGIGTTSPLQLLHVSTGDNSDLGEVSISVGGTISNARTGSIIKDTSTPYDLKIRSSEDSSSDTAITFETKGTSGERMRIDSSGRLLVGTSSRSDPPKLVVQGNVGGGGAGGGILALSSIYGASIGGAGAYAGQIKFTDSLGGVFGNISCQADGANATNDYPGRLVFSTTADGASSPTERMKIDSVGRFFCQGIYDNTSAVSSNVTVNTSGRLQRATSSSKYKTNIEALEDSYADAILGCRPVWYRSTCEGDNPNYGWWGFIAEEVAEIDPRLVYWKTVEITYDENGSVVETPCDPEPEGVQYDRFVPHLLNLIKRQKEQIEAMEARLSALEA